LKPLKIRCDIVHPLFSEHLSNVKLVGKKRIEKGVISKEEREDV